MDLLPNLIEHEAILKSSKLKEDQKELMCSYIVTELNLMFNKGQRLKTKTMKFLVELLSNQTWHLSIKISILDLLMKNSE